MLFALANRLEKPNITSPIQMLMGDVLPVNHDRLIVLTIATFICLALIPMYGPSAIAQAAAPKIVADRPVVPLWNLGGKVNLTVSQIPVNVTYYVWLQRPAQSSSYGGFQFINSGNTASVPIQVTVSATDSAGTYTVSLSTSTFSDTKTAIAHFGMYGTDSRVYQRTNKMKIAGGGFAPNSTVSVNVQVGAQALSGFPTNVTAGSRGDLTYTYSVLPSAPVAAVTVSATGPAYDSHNSTSVSSVATIQPTTLAVNILTQPTPSVERTTNVPIAYSISYPDKSPVTTSTANSTRVFVVSDAGTEVAEVALSLSDPSTGRWQAIWVPPPSMNLARYHFEISPRDFDDSFGNLGTGNMLASLGFAITPAKVQLVLQGNATIQRTQDARLVATAQYHNGVQFTNVTQATGVITEPDNRTTHPIVFNSTPNEFIARYNTTISSPLGQVLLSATLTDLFGNTASGTLTIQVVKATTNFAVNIPTSVERTTVLNVSARITYPDGSVLTPDLVPSGFNLTITQGNFTWIGRMDFNLTTNTWSSGYPTPQNATLGDYSIKIGLLDRYENGGNFSSSSTVIPARFRFYLPLPSMRAGPGTLLNVLVLVKYPNGSLLAPRVKGVVTASFTNSTGTFTLPLIFNATDATWHMFFLVPDPGLRFGLTLTFSFAADDAFGNAGSAANAFRLDVGAGTQTLILASIIGAIPPIALLGWAIATVTARRRKYKP